MDVSGQGEDSSSSEEHGSFPSCECVHIKGDNPFPQTKLDCSQRGYALIAPGSALPGNIHELDLSGNRIHFLEKGIFDFSFHLNKLVIQNNGLIKIHKGTFEELVFLEILDLSGNNILELQEDLFHNLTSLRELDLSQNKLSSLSTNLFSGIETLESLSLSGNKGIGSYLHETPDAVKDVLRRGLRSLNLNAINLTDIPENLFNEAPNLQELDISHNRFTKLPDLWLGALRVLNVSRSNITVLETGSFLSLQNLRVLRLDHLSDLVAVQEGTFVGLKYLEVLTLERCYNLTSFSDMAFGGPSTATSPRHVLNLKHGGLETISKNLLPIFSKIEHIYLQGNPWSCDCRLRWLKEVKFSKQASEHLLCFSPSHLHNQTISSVDSSDFVCITKQGRLLYGLLVSMAVVFTIVALLLILAYCDILRRRRIRKMMGSRVHYDPMTVQLNPHHSENYWDDPDGDTSISFIRGNRML